MKYESSILKRLVDTYGVVGNPRYISEIIKEFIVRGKERFPELFTYQSDWLAHIDEFGLNPTYTVSYTGQSIYAPNTLERPVKSAILKGCTLVNISIIKEYSFSSTQIQIKCYNNEMIKTNTEYTIIYDITDTNNLGSVMLDCFGNTPLPITLGRHKIKFTTLTSLKNNSNMYISGGFVGVVDNIMIIEGDYINVDIPYFTGMQSVKMPGLTVTGKNLFDGELVRGNISGGNGEDLNTGDFMARMCRTNYIKVTPGSDFTASIEGNYIIEKISETDKDKKFIKTTEKNAQSISIKLSNNTSFIRCVIKSANSGNITLDDVRSSNIQLEESPTKTSYEPHKTNILTVNEDITLRSNGSVYDELDLLTGELTQRIDENGEVLSQEVVKTVDLTILDQNGQNVKQLMSFNGGTHFNTTSLEGSPLPVVSVGVETDLEEILMMCSLEGNTL